MKPNLFIVFLRRPGRSDERSDPYWEFGSFGCTGCHDDNLLNPEREYVNTGDRLAFVQGGDEGCKLLLITPPVRRDQFGKTRVVLRWKKALQPFCYKSKHAPVLAEPGAANTKLVELGKLVNGANRRTAQAKLASRFRSRGRPIDPRAAEELTVLFEKARKAATDSDLIRSYSEALPWPIQSPRSLKERSRDHRRWMSGLGRKSVGSSCRPKAAGCKR